MSGGLGAVISRVRSRVSIRITHVRGLIALPKGSMYLYSRYLSLKGVPI